MTSVSYTLQIEGRPAPADLLAAIQQIEVEEHAGMADMLRLHLAFAVREDGTDWTFLDDELFERLTNLRLLVTAGNGLSEPLIDAFVIETSANFSSQPGMSTLEIVATDATVKMNLEEKVRAWPNMSDADIATTIFGEYGFTTDVQSTQPQRSEDEVTVIQRSTDIQFLRRLAERNGYECYVDLHPQTQLPTGHFHPPRLDGQEQGVLTVNMGAHTNVNRFNARYDMLRPTTAQIADVDVATQEDQDAEVSDISLTVLGSTPVLNGDARRTLLGQTGLSQTGELQTYAQATVDRSGWAITAEGELNTVSYQGVLRAKRPVLVRGVGQQFSGTYYVESVLHTITSESYTQQFTLRRNALGLTGRENFAAGGSF